MGFKDLKIFLDKEKRVYLILAIWLVIGYTIFQFSPSYLLGIIVFGPLIFTCLVFFVLSLFLKEKIQESPWKFLFLSIIIGIPLWIILLSFIIGLVIMVFITLIGLNFFFFITTIFTSKDWYEKTTKWDDKIANWPSPVNSIVRIGLFLGGAIIATMLLMIFSTLALNIKDTSYTYQLVINSIFLDILVVIWILFIIGILSVFFGRVNLWLGIFFVFIVVLAINLIISAVIYERGPSALYLPFLIIQYLINLYLLLGSIAVLFGEQSDLIAEKSKIFTSDSILLLLVFSMASMQFAAGVAEEGLSEVELLFTALAIPILIFIFGIYGIYSYNKKFKKEKESNE
ncbi:MAG: hypothetical protein ACFFAO_06470 [Candidatus Hermodarchaeota archaeon]